MMSKEKLREISDLNLEGFIDGISLEQYEEYCSLLDSFVEKAPGWEALLKRDFERGNFEEFEKNLAEVKAVLDKTRAVSLSEDCDKLAAEAKSARHERMEAFLTYFLTAISTLSIDIQMAQYEKAEVKTAVQEVQELPDENGQKVILAVDDISLFLNALKSTLQNSGYKFYGVTSGEAALKFVQNHRPNLFILDVEMPEMNGYELAEKLRRCGQKAPIIFLTGNSTREYVIKAIKAGAADFIVKPINKDHVLEKIDKHIK